MFAVVNTNISVVVRVGKGGQAKTKNFGWSLLVTFSEDVF